MCGFGLSKDHADDYPGWLHMFILAPDGSTTLQQERRRSISRYACAAPDPHMARVLTTRSRAIFCIQEIAQLGTQLSERWLVHHLDTGDMLAEFRPADRLRGHRITSIVTALAIPESDYLLIEWYSDPFTDRGVVIALLGPAFQPVWTLALPRDYLMSDRDTQSLAFQFVARAGTISCPGVAREFEVYEMKAQMIHRYRISDDNPNAPAVVQIHSRMPESSEHWKARLRSLGTPELRSPEARIPTVPRSRRNVPVSQPTSTSRPR